MREKRFGFDGYRDEEDDDEQYGNDFDNVITDLKQLKQNLIATVSLDATDFIINY